MTCYQYERTLVLYGRTRYVNSFVVLGPVNVLNGTSVALDSPTWNDANGAYCQVWRLKALTSPPSYFGDYIQFEVAPAI